MQHIPTSEPVHEPLRIVFNDRVVFLPLGDHATLGDIAQAVRGFGSRRHGQPVAIDVTLGDSWALSGLPRKLPPGVTAAASAR